MNKYNGPARDDRFYVTFSFPQQLSQLNSYVSDLTLQCRGTELPGITLHTTDYRTYGPPKQIPTLKMYYEHTFAFYCTNNFHERPLFESWIEFINPAQNGWDFRYRDDYVSTITIAQLDQADNVVYMVQLLEAFPTAVHPQGIGWDNDNIHTLPVTFSFYRYEIINNSLFNTIFNSTNLNATFGIV